MAAITKRASAGVIVEREHAPQCLARPERERESRKDAKASAAGAGVATGGES